MTTVQVRRDENGVCGLSVKGHAGYAKSGQDIVCAAASVLITTCANALQSVADITPQLEVTEKPALIAVNLPKGLSPAQDHDARIILNTILQGFQDIAAQYPRYLQII